MSSPNENPTIEPRHLFTVTDRGIKVSRDQLERVDGFLGWQLYAPGGDAERWQALSPLRTLAAAAIDEIIISRHPSSGRRASLGRVGVHGPQITLPLIEAHQVLDFSKVLHASILNHDYEPRGKSGIY